MTTDNALLWLKTLHDGVSFLRLYKCGLPAKILSTTFKPSETGAVLLGAKAEAHELTPTKFTGPRHPFSLN
jgi:hypothetical protein